MVRPVRDRIPDTPTGLAVQAVGQDKIRCVCNPVPDADRYLWEITTPPGTISHEQELQAKATTQTPFADFEQLAAGLEMQVHVQAAALVAEAALPADQRGLGPREWVSPWTEFLPFLMPAGAVSPHKPGSCSQVIRRAFALIANSTSGFDGTESLNALDDLRNVLANMALEPDFLPIVHRVYPVPPGYERQQPILWGPYITAAEGFVGPLPYEISQCWDQHSIYTEASGLDLAGVALRAGAIGLDGFQLPIDSGTYWIEKTGPAFKIWFPDDNQRTLGPDMNFLLREAIGIPDDDGAALDYVLEVDPGVRAFIEYDLALNLYGRFGPESASLQAGLIEQRRRLMMNVKRRNNQPQRMRSSNPGVAGNLGAPRRGGRRFGNI